MVDFLDWIYSSTAKNNNRFLHKLRYYSLIRFIIRNIANALLSIYFIVTRRNKKYCLDSLENSNEVIVSLTSFPARIHKVWLTIETILRQTVKPRKIILWLSKEQFPSAESIPANLLKMEDRGLTIRLVDDDLRSHKKYYYLMTEYPNNPFLLIDDDIFYRSSMIEDLLRYSKSYPHCIISQYSRKIEWNKNRLLPYSKWGTVTTEMSPSEKIFFGTGGGTLFPPNSLFEDVLKKELFMQLTPTADDIWLNAMCRLKHTKILKTQYYSLNLPVLCFKNISLTSINIGMNKNDIQILNVRDYYLKEKNIDPFVKT